ncbi:DUF4177 domain-containing protein [candidate division KSB3 bacterium]|uniref:DUF4177 domain-containing protein n=1 Tax=candidate division KSB3 bacterium TaxID=2044937 RepID=A0A2G6KGT3_9BACT|nr:MAG: DUF4177 domain-containing protein [candidate division KSB3 bacterium]
MEERITYKVIELSIVTDEAIEEVLNQWTGKGWTFDRLQFAMGDGSKRPAMAFVFFVRSLETGELGKGG